MGRAFIAILVGLAACDALSGLSDFRVGDAGDPATTASTGGSNAGGMGGSFAQGGAGGTGGAGGGAAAPCVSAVGALWANTCALLSDGTVWCSGNNQYGQLGDGSYTSSSLPVKAQIADVVELDVGRSFVIVRTASGEVHGWGDNSWGQLGVDPNMLIDAPLPMRVTTIGDASDIGAGASHACAVHGGALSCWGGNQHAQLALPDENPLLQAAPRTVFDSNIASLHVGSVHTCAVNASDQRISCWGGNNRGQVGTAPVSSVETPANYTGAVTATRITGRATHNCALGADGSAWCWGRNELGELGVGGGDAYVPVQVPGVPAFEQLFAGGRRHCGRTATGEVWCWGEVVVELDFGPPRNPGGDVRPPEIVSELQGAIDASFSPYHHCAVFADGRLRCLGHNDQGQLGDGTTTTATAWVEAQLPCR